MYLLQTGEGKGIALYTRCEDELLAKAELLLLAEKARQDSPGVPIFGYCDVDPSFTISEFKKTYRGHPADYRKLMAHRQSIIQNGWAYFEIENDPS